MGRLDEVNLDERLPRQARGAWDRRRPSCSRAGTLEAVIAALAGGLRDVSEEPVTSESGR